MTETIELYRVNEKSVNTPKCYLTFDVHEICPYILAVDATYVVSALSNIGLH